MQKLSWSFSVAPLAAPVGVTRWGHFGTPVVLFASAGGDSLEPERLQLIQALGPLIDSGRIKVYAIDGAAMRVLLAGTATPAERARALFAFDEWVATGLAPQVHRDCHSDALELLACGCAFGAASALQALLRHPGLMRGAIGLSGTYDLRPWISAELAVAMPVSPLQWPGAPPPAEQLARLRTRAVTLACTAGDYEDPAPTEAMAARLREHGISVNAQVWSPGFDFGFSSWRQMLPRFVSEWL